MQVYSYCTRVIVNDTAGGGLPQLEVVPEGEPLTSPLCTALIMEYCDMGSLADAIDCGAFAKAARAAARASGGSSSSRVSDLHQSASGLLPRRMDVAATAGTPAMRAVYLTLLEVALALRHLHSMNLVHCDVKPANVLLRSSATDPRGFTAKLTDFGGWCVHGRVGAHHMILSPNKPRPTGAGVAVHVKDGVIKSQGEGRHDWGGTAARH